MFPLKFPRYKPSRKPRWDDASKRWITDNPLTADRLNATLEANERQAKISVAPPLAIRDTPDGRCLELQDAKEFPAALTGSTSPYTFAEVYATPSGEWQLKPGGRTGTAYEANGVSGLGV